MYTNILNLTSSTTCLAPLEFFFLFLLNDGRSTLQLMNHVGSVPVEIQKNVVPLLAYFLIDSLRHIQCLRYGIEDKRSSKTAAGFLFQLKNLDFWVFFSPTCLGLGLVVA